MAEKPRVLHITTALDFGGVETHMRMIHLHQRASAAYKAVGANAVKDKHAGSKNRRLRIRGS